MELTLRRNERLTGQVFRLVFEGPVPEGIVPGQFAQVLVEPFYLRRPVSLCDWDRETLTLVVRETGEGTKALAKMAPGQKADLLFPLGNGYRCGLTGDRPLLVGGGVGLPPLLGLYKALRALGKEPAVLCGFSCRQDSFLLEDFRAAGCEPLTATLDGSLGKKGLVTDLMDDCRYDSVCACGPHAMMKAVYQKASCPGQYSLEERMGCGFGACMGCSVRTRSGMKRVCADGPVLTGEEVLW